MALYSRDSSLFRQSVRGVSCGYPVDGGCDPDRWAGVLGRLDTLRLGSLAGCAPSHHEPYSLAVTREAGERREGRDPKFEVRGSKFRKLSSSDLEPLLVPPVPRGGRSC